MKPGGHIFLSAAVGAGVAVATGSPWAFGAAMGTGVLIDSDHTLDYYRWFIRRRTERVFYLFHGWEHLAILVLVTALLGWHPIMIGATLGYLSHLIADQVVNHAYPFTYSIVYRALHGFRMGRVSPWSVEGSFKDLLDIARGIPFGTRALPIAMRLLGRWAPKMEPAPATVDQHGA